MTSIIEILQVFPGVFCYFLCLYYNMQIVNLIGFKKCNKCTRSFKMDCYVAVSYFFNILSTKTGFGQLQDA